ncbi:hypothetical protein MK280_13740 [Myxococcota bacterium]|nr:hypothetical protein [Myxococcota bacterium]
MPRSAVVTRAPSKPEPDEDLPETQVELTSRGDRVVWTLWQSEANSTGRLVILQAGLGQCIDFRHRATVRRLLDQGLSVATLDWPLHGPRHSPKLSARLLKAIEVTEGDPNGVGLVHYLMQQSVLDLHRSLDWTAEQTQLSTQRVALLGSTEAAPLITLFAALDPRAAVLALYGRPVDSPGPLPDVFKTLAQSALNAMLWLAPKPTSAESKAWAEALRRNFPGEFYADAQGQDPSELLEPASANRVCEFINESLA